jgi:hypothetical protein
VKESPGLPGRVLRLCCDACAMAGGLILLAMAGMTLASVVGRAFFARPVPGDVELVQIGTAVAIALFLPYTQLRGGNIIVDVFTAHASPRAKARMDGFGTLLYTLAMALIAWRLFRRRPRGARIPGDVDADGLSHLDRVHADGAGLALAAPIGRPRHAAPLVRAAGRRGVSTFAIGIALFGAMLALMAIRVPIAIAMFVPGGGLRGLVRLGAAPRAPEGRRLRAAVGLRPLGDPALHADGRLRRARRALTALFDFANALLGRFKGGMAMAAVLACAAFGSISGSTVATTATIAQVAYPEMRARAIPALRHRGARPPAAPWACCCRPPSRLIGLRHPHPPPSREHRQGVPRRSRARDAPPPAAYIAADRGLRAT